MKRDKGEWNLTFVLLTGSRESNKIEMLKNPIIALMIKKGDIGSYSYDG